MAYGAALIDADTGRMGEVSALGLDETLFCRTGRWRTQQWCTSIVDVTPSHTQLLDVVAGRSAAGPSAWLDERAEDWRAAIRFGVLDLSGPYCKTFDDTLQHVTQVADPFHLVKLANSKLDECRPRVQNETLGHRGRKDDALYRARRLLTKAHERLDERGETKLLRLLDAGDPRGPIAWHAKEVADRSTRSVTPELAGAFVDHLGVDLQDESCPPEVRSLGRTIVRWRDQIVAWHQALVSNGPTEAVNNLIERIKRIGFGSGASPITGSACSSTPAAPTGAYWRRSLPAETDEPVMPSAHGHHMAGRSVPLS
jgi:transposase